MPKLVSTPSTLRPFLFHGVFLDWEGRTQATGDCPFCGREEKFAVGVENGLWQCFVCRAGTDRGGGNIMTFLRLLWDESDKATTGEKEFSQERGLLYPETLNHWGVCQSIITKEWLIPGYTVDGKLGQLYKRIKFPDRWELRPTPGLGHQLHGMPLFDPKKSTIYLHESWGNALAFWETARMAKVVEDGKLAQTGNELQSLLADANVLSVANCGAAGESLAKFLPLFEGKTVITMFDNDHPREANGRTVEGGGLGASKRTAALLASADNPPKEILWLRWGEQGHDSNYPHGYDIRDALTGTTSAAERVTEALPRLLSKIASVPEEWIAGRRVTKGPGGIELELLSCSSWKELTTAWRKALKWIPGLDRALAVMLATITSTESVGDQLWIKIVGPPSCGKSVLCEAISVNRKYVMPKSTIRGLFSGYQTDRDGVEDMSLAPRLKNMTLVTKDGDTLLQMPNLGQILAEFRDLYDRVSRTHYKNKQSRDYEGLSLTYILCGTEALRQLDSSELGERMLDCVIADTLPEDVEDEISLRKAHQADRELAYKSDGRADTREGPEMVLAKRLTGGYVDYLRKNAQKLLGQVEMSEEAKRQCVALGTFVSFMRCRPSKKQDETVQRELSFRLVSQHVRLAKCLAVVLNRKEVDQAVMDRVREVTLDTSRGRTLEIAKKLYRDNGAETKSLALWVGDSQDRVATLIRFLKRIHAVEQIPSKDATKRWRLTDRVRRLYKEATGA